MSKRLELIKLLKTEFLVLSIMAILYLILILKQFKVI